MKTLLAHILTAVVLVLAVVLCGYLDRFGNILE
jgi:hypothetical protein